MGVKEHQLACRNQQRIVVFSELAGSRKNKRRLVVVSQRSNVGIGKDIVAGQAFDAAVTCVQHCQSTIVESTHHIGIGTRNFHAR